MNISPGIPALLSSLGRSESRTTTGPHEMVEFVDGPPRDQFESGEDGWRLVHGGEPNDSVILVRFAIIAAIATYALALAGLGWRLTQWEYAVAAEPSPPATSQAPPMGSLVMGEVSTGVVAVDDSIRGMLVGDVDAAVSQFELHQVHCGTLPWGGLPPLACRVAEPTGSAHELLLSTCGPMWVTVAEAREVFATLLNATPGLIGVVRVSGGYLAALSWPLARDQSLELTISSAGITSFRSGCGPSTITDPGLGPVAATRR